MKETELKSHIKNGASGGYLFFGDEDYMKSKSTWFNKKYSPGSMPWGFSFIELVDLGGNSILFE